MFVFLALSSANSTSDLSKDWWYDRASSVFCGASGKFYHNCYYVETKGMYDLINSCCLLYLAEKELTATCSLSKVQLSDPVNKKNPATKGCPKRYGWEIILHNLSGCLLSIKSSISGCIPIPLLEDR